MLKKPLEKDIEQSILCYLEAIGLDAYKIPRHGIYDLRREKFRLSNNRFMRKSVGHSDIVLLLKNPHRVIFLEVKRPKVGKQSDEQKEFQQMIERNDGYYYIVTSIEDTSKILSDLIVDKNTRTSFDFEKKFTDN